MADIKRPLPPDSYGGQRRVRPTRHADTHGAGGSDPLSGAVAINLNDLLDVIITALASGDTIRYNGTNWINSAYLKNSGIRVDIGGATEPKLHLHHDGKTWGTDAGGFIEFWDNVARGGWLGFGGGFDGNFYINAERVGTQLILRVENVAKMVLSPSGVHIGTTSAAPFFRSGTGSPEGAITAPVGSIYMRTDGGSGTTIYNKESGAGNTGWVADAPGGGGGGAIAVSERNPLGSNFTVAADEGAVVPYSFEVASGFSLEVAAGGVFEVT